MIPEHGACVGEHAAIRGCDRGQMAIGAHEDAMRIFDEAGRILATPGVIAYLHERVQAEPAIMAVATDLQPEPQQWGSTSLHFAARHHDSGQAVLLKLNVPPDQLWWTRTLASINSGCIPRVYGSGHLASDEVGWVLWERIEGGLHPGWLGREFDMLLEAGVAFQIASRALGQAAEQAGILHTLQIDDLAAAIEAGVRRAAPGPAAEVLRRLPGDWDWIHSVCEREICHGDLHMANALCREGQAEPQALLIDYHPTLMPWACEPAKPEILNADPARPGCRHLVAKQAVIRARHGLPVPAGAELARLEAIVLGWWAIQMWAYIGDAPDPTWRSPQVWYAENLSYITAAAQA